MKSQLFIVYLKRILIAVVLVSPIGFDGLFASASALAQNRFDEEALVRVEPSVAPETVVVGGTAVLRLKLRLPTGAHSNSNSPADPNLIPTAFYPKAQSGVTWGHPRYPPPKNVVEWYSDEPLSVFEDGAVITVDVGVGESASKGRLVLEGTLEIQVCDNEKCYPPRQLPVRAGIKVVSEVDGSSVGESNSNSVRRNDSGGNLATKSPDGQNVKSVSEIFSGELVAFDFLDFAGQPRKLSEFRGKFVLLDFWATWCRPCLADIPKLKILYDRYRADGFEIIGMGSETLTGDAEGADLEFAKEAEERARKIVVTRGVLWIQATSETAVPVATKIFGIKTLPTKILIDREGRVIATIGEKDDLEAIVSKLLAKAN